MAGPIPPGLPPGVGTLARVATSSAASGSRGNFGSGFASGLGWQASKQVFATIGSNAFLFFLLTAAINFATIFIFAPIRLNILLAAQTFFLFLSWALLDKSEEVRLSCIRRFAWLSAILFGVSHGNYLISNFSYLKDAIGPVLFFYFVGGILGFFMLQGMESPIHRVGKILGILGMPLVAGFALGAFLYYGSQIAELSTLIGTSAAALGSITLVQTAIMTLIVTWWSLWALKYAARENVLARILFFLIVLLYVIVFLSIAWKLGWFSGQTQELDFSYTSALDILFPVASQGFSQFINSTLAIWSGTQEDLNRITDPNFERRVEDQSGVNFVGIFLDRPTLQSPTTQIGEDLVVLTGISGKSVGLPHQVSTSCKMVYNGREYPGQMNRDQLSVSTEQSRAISCTIPSDQTGQLVTNRFDDSASVDVVVSASYVGEASGYTRRHFISQSRFLQLEQEGVDIYDAYGLSAQRAPVSTTTSGPLDIVLGTLNGIEPIPDSPNGETIELFIKLELRSGFEGKITDFEQFYFYIPDGFDLTSSSSCPVEPLSASVCQSFCDPQDAFCLGDCQQFSMFQIPISNPELPLRYVCDLEPQSARTVLGNTPIAIDSFRGSARFIYEVSKQLRVQLEGQSEEFFSEETSFTGLPIENDLSSSVQYRFDQYGTQYENLLFNSTTRATLFDYPTTDSDIRFLTNGFILYFYDYYHSGDSTYCANGFDLAGLTGISIEELYGQNTCPPRNERSNLAKSAQEQITALAQSLNSYKSTCDSADCIVGKHFCGDTFAVGNYNSCTKHSCNWCQDTLVPNVLTYAQELYDQVGDVR